MLIETRCTEIIKPGSGCQCVCIQLRRFNVRCVSELLSHYVMLKVSEYWNVMISVIVSLCVKEWVRCFQTATHTQSYSSENFLHFNVNRNIDICQMCPNDFLAVFNSSRQYTATCLSQNDHLLHMEPSHCSRRYRGEKANIKIKVEN